ncbi:hypothetical protein LJ721_004724 [Salmonella enterica]|nr:hypothetical protein [Salmonella enterica]
MTAKAKGSKRRFLQGTIGGVRVIAAGNVQDSNEPQWDKKPVEVITENAKYDETYTGPRNTANKSDDSVIEGKDISLTDEEEKELAAQVAFNRGFKAGMKNNTSERPEVIDGKEDKEFAALVNQVSVRMNKLVNILARDVADGSIRRKRATQAHSQARRAAVMDGGLEAYLKDNADEDNAQITEDGGLVTGEHEEINIIDESGKVTQGYKAVRYEGDERPEGAIAAAFRRANDNNMPDTQAKETQRAANIVNDLDDVGIKQGEEHEQRAMDAAYKLDHELIPVSGGQIFRKDLRAFGESVMNKQYARIRSFYRDDNGNRVYLK